MRYVTRDLCYFKVFTFPSQCALQGTECRTGMSSDSLLITIPGCYLTGEVRVAIPAIDFNEAHLGVHLP